MFLPHLPSKYRFGSYYFTLFVELASQFLSELDKQKLPSPE